jgi:hypothetical protein
MNRESNEQAFEPARGETVGPSRQFGKAICVGVLAFVLVLGLIWLNHPLLLKRHLDRVFVQCLLAALIAFAATWFVDSQKKLEG